MDLDSAFRQHYRQLCFYAMHYLGPDVQWAEDVVQEVFVRLYTTDSHPLNVKAWLYQSVRHGAIDALRRHRPEAAAIDATLQPSDLEDTITDAEAIDRSEQEARLWETISQLPDRCREVLLLGKRDGLTYQQIADQMGISVKTVEKQMAKALQLLRANKRSILFVVSLM